MKKKIILSTIIILLLVMTACSKNNKDALNFKKDYESLNGQTTSNGKEHRKLNIPKNNPFVITDAATIVEKLANGETFYVYFGSKLCPWCRSVIEKAIEVANANEIDKIYYVDIWDDEGNEILRDKYVLDEDGKAILIKDGTEDYFKILDYFKAVLPDYTYAANKNGGDKLDIKEKRIYVPLFVYVAKGTPARAVSGISDKQTKSREELTDEILADEEKIFDEFFINVCDDSC